MKTNIIVPIILVLMCLANCCGVRRLRVLAAPPTRLNQNVQTRPSAYDEIPNLLSNITSLRNRLVQSHGLCKAIDTSRTQQITIYKELIKKLESNITTHLHTIINKTNEVVQLKDNLHVNAQELWNLKVGHNEMSAQLTASEKIIADLRKELAQVKGELSTGKTQIMSQNLTIVKLTQTLKDQTEANEKFKAEAVSYKDKFMDCSARIEELQSNIIDSNELIGSMNKKIADLQSQTKSDAAKIQKLNSLIEDATTCCSASSCMPFGQSTNVHVIKVAGSGEPFQVRCNGVLAGPGWTVIQRRFNGSVDFYRNWTDYKTGFGSLSGEFFIGLENLHHITAAERQELYIQLEDFDGEKRHIQYDNFKVGTEQESYALQSLGEHAGNIKNSMYPNVGQKFSTFDRDNDNDASRHCAKELHGAGWYNGCGLSNLNGLYLEEDVEYDNIGEGIFWDDDWHTMAYSFKSVEIMIRPKPL